MLSQWLWFMVCYAKPVVMYYCELWGARGCESWCAMPSQWSIIAMWYVVSVVLNHVVLCWSSGWKPRSEWCASGCGSMWAMLSQWLSIMVYYSVPVVQNHCVLCWFIGSESWGIILCQWLWIMSFAEPVIVIHGVLFWASDCYSCCAMQSQWVDIIMWMLCQLVWIMVRYPEPVVVNHRVICWVMLNQWLWIIMC